MKIETFEIQYLQEAKDALKSAFFRKESDEIFNEWDESGGVPNNPLCDGVY